MMHLEYLFVVDKYYIHENYNGIIKSRKKNRHWILEKNIDNKFVR